MSVREAIEERVSLGPAVEDDGLRPRLPSSLGKDASGARTGLLRRLAGSRTFALGDRSGVLRAAQRRSGRAFRLDVRQRVVVKALVCRHVGRGAERAAALGKHVVYLGRAGAGLDGDRPEFFDAAADDLETRLATADWRGDRHHFRFIISPEHGDRLALKAYVREVMARVSADLGEPDLTWFATCHYDTDQPHAHVLVRGVRSDGRDLVIPRDYIGYGFRARAQEVAQERLGDLSRVEAERRVWKETEADRFTGFDRRLIAQADGDGLVEDGVGATHAWAALTRGRLRHLERLGLATPEAGRRYRLDGELETRLRTLQVRRDVIRTLNQRRLEGARDVRVLDGEVIRGVVVKTGCHDEAGAAPWAVVRDGAAVEHYARLRAGSPGLQVGRVATLKSGPKGLAQVVLGRGADLER
ncbi:DUF3363 domain-containing protein [Brevundimonas sp.]|uniref:DUF3363 domain-containing protein n=1 Tax=Brevundimonas sp. TaxID=1871086 RepID=UPI0035B286E0